MTALGGCLAGCWMSYNVLEAVAQQREKELSLQLEALQGQVGAQQRLIMVTMRSVPLLGRMAHHRYRHESCRQCNLAMPQQ